MSYERLAKEVLFSDIDVDRLRELREKLKDGKTLRDLENEIVSAKVRTSFSLARSVSRLGRRLKCVVAL